MSSTANMDTNHLSAFERATRQYVVINQLTRLTIGHKDVILAQKIKTRIAKMLEACVSSDRNRPMIRLIINHTKLEKALTRFIVSALREEYTLVNTIED